MSSNNGDMDAARRLLSRAVELDKSGRRTEAVICYQEGIQVLMDAAKGMSDPKAAEACRSKARECLDRAERLSASIQKERREGRYREEVEIVEGQTGCSYESLFGRLLSGEVTRAEVEDPYIRAHHQLVNFLRFCELLVRRCPSLAEIQLATSRDPNPNHAADQEKRLEEIREDLERRNVQLKVSYSPTLHDREIRLDTGWAIRIGRGLDIYKAPPPERRRGGRLHLGQFDLDLRECHQTKVDIFHREELVRRRKSEQKK